MLIYSLYVSRNNTRLDKMYMHRYARLSPKCFEPEMWMPRCEIRSYEGNKARIIREQFMDNMKIFNQ